MNRFSCVVLNWRTLLLRTIGSAASILLLARTASSHAYKEHADRKTPCRDGPQSTLTAERWRVHYNTIRPHSSLGYRSPAPETWQPKMKTGYGEVESKVRFPLPHTLDGDEILTKINALH